MNDLKAYLDLKRREEDVMREIRILVSKRANAKTRDEYLRQDDMRDQVSEELTQIRAKINEMEVDAQNDREN